MVAFEDIEKFAIHRSLKTILLQSIVFAALFHLFTDQTSLVMAPWLATVLLGFISALFEIFWRLVPTLSYHSRNTQAGGAAYRRAVEDAMDVIGLKRMLASFWFVRKIEDVLNKKKL